ncbi:MAG: efflux RND transporter periplasmic adaptor subunit [Holophaga sp.]|nr:efflux RND transporter periplasmic adaptor subunit [Holophaga sp.]
MKRRNIWMLAGGALLIVIIGVAATRGDKGLPVQVTAVNRETITAKVSANGKVQAVAKVDISANIMGQVTRLAVKEGDFVKKGQFIMEIDPSRSRANAESLQANVEAANTEFQSAEARLAQAKADFTRAEANRKAGIIAQADFEQQRTALTTATNTAQSARRRVEQAKADLRGASVSLRYSTITAPMDGVVTARRIEQGETAVIGVQNQAGTVLVTISDMSKVEAELEVDEASIPNVKLGQNAQVRIDAYPNQSFDAVVTEVGGSPLLKLTQNEATKFKVKVQMKNPPLTIKPGLSAQAEIFTGSRENALAIPLQALVMKEIKLKDGEKAKPGAAKEEEGVYLMEGGKAKFVPVKTGLMGELNVEVTEGLKGGESVVTGPFRTLRDLKGGETVRVDKTRKGSAAPDERKAS